MALVKVKLEDIHDSPYRDPSAYHIIPDKVQAIVQSMLTTEAYWENILARKTKDGKIELAYGHHRVAGIRWIVANAKEHGEASPYYYLGREFEEGIKLNVWPETKLNNEKMLQIFAEENASVWQDSAQNTLMTIMQVKAHIEQHLQASVSLEDFMAKVKGAGEIQMDVRSFTRFKNGGIGASTISQYLGSKAFSRQTIQDSLALLESGADSERFKKLVEGLPNVTLANRFQKLVTKGSKGKGKNKETTLFSDEVQEKVADTITKEGLTRSDVEDAIKLQESMDTPDPVAAIKAVVKSKKEERKAAADVDRAGRPVPATPGEKVVKAIERATELVDLNKAVLTAKDYKGIIQALKDFQEELKKPLPETATSGSPNENVEYSEE